MTLFPVNADWRSTKDNRVSMQDRPVHDWYRFVLSYPPHLVRDYVQKFGIQPGQCVLDPFCGTGTTPVECKKLRISSVGIEANPIAFLASKTKVDWTLSPAKLKEHADMVATRARAALLKWGIDDDDPVPRLASRGKLLTLGDEQSKLLLTDSISPLPLHKSLVLLGEIDKENCQPFYRHEVVALAKALVNPISNLHFGPEVGVGDIKDNSPVIGPWLENMYSMIDDLKLVCDRKAVPSRILHLDSRKAGCEVAANSIDAIITSPPYPNEKDYTRTTRLESVLLGLIRTKKELQAFKRNLLRSNTRNVYKGDDDDKHISSVPEIARIADAIESRRIELGKTSGFERLYAKVTRLYFGGMARHFMAMKPLLKPGAHLAYVVGDQASYLRVMIRTGELLAKIAQALGYELLGIDLFRTRTATATRSQLREEVVVLRWPG